MAKTDLMTDTGRGAAAFPAGTPVEVRNRFVGSWARGFEVVGSAGDGLVVRRLSDGAVLGEPVHADEVRPVEPPPTW